MQFYPLFKFSQFYFPIQHHFTLKYKYMFMHNIYLILKFINNWINQLWVNATTGLNEMHSHIAILIQNDEVYYSVYYIESAVKGHISVV